MKLSSLCNKKIKEKDCKRDETLHVDNCMSMGR